MNNYYETYLVLDKGKAYCMVDNKRYSINKKYLKKALNNDKILVKLKNETVYIQKILERSCERLIGKIIKNNNISFIKVWNFSYENFLCLENFENDDIVEFEFRSWNKKEKSPVAGNVKKINLSKDKELLIKHNITNIFDKRIISEAERLEIENIIDNRIDLTHLNVFSIDPENCTDVDDALSYEDTQFGYRIGVHIADVTAFVQTGSLIDMEAYKRSFTVYHPLYNVPLLPYKLSYNLCSLKENKERLAVSLMINFDREWNVVDYYVFRSKIKNKKRFSYNQAEQAKNDPTNDYYNILNTLYTVGNKLRKIHFPKELNLNIPAFDYIIENDIIENVYPKKRLSTMELIQSWMLICNMFMTKKVEEKGNSCLYRTHSYPIKSKVEYLKSIKKWNDNKGFFFNYNNILKENKFENPFLLLKSLKPAKYGEKKYHFMLGTNQYSHFTSPIRRYADIINHRILFKSLKDKKVNYHNLSSIAKHINKIEQNIDIFYKSSEIDIVKDYLKKLDHFKAYVVGYTNTNIILISEHNIEIYMHVVDGNMHEYNTTLTVKYVKADENKIYVSEWKI